MSRELRNQKSLENLYHHKVSKVRLLRFWFPITVVSVQATTFAGVNFLRLMRLLQWFKHNTHKSNTRTPVSTPNADEHIPHGFDKALSLFDCKAECVVESNELKFFACAKFCSLLCDSRCSPIMQFNLFQDGVFQRFSCAKLTEIAATWTERETIDFYGLINTIEFRFLGKHRKQGSLTQFSYWVVLF